MIKGKTKDKLLKEIQKFGNVFLSCQKIGVDKSTYYRWKQKNKKFKEQADEAERIGHENICDVAEFALIQNIKDKNQRAIEFALRAHSERYRQRAPSQVVIVHRKESNIENIPPIRTLEDLLADYTGEDDDSGEINTVLDIPLIQDPNAKDELKK